MHPLQSPEWGEFRKKNGNLVSRINEYQVIWSKLPKLPYYFGTLLKSPIPTKQDLEDFKKEGKRIGGIGIRIEPDATSGKMPNGLIKGRRFFTTETYWLDLTKSDEELLTAMHPKARYNIRLAQKHEVEVREDNSEIAFEKFLELTEQTSKRQGFYAHDKKYFQLMWQAMREKIAHLFVAKYKNEILTTWIIFKYGDKIYYPYGASSDKYREVMAPSLMLWKTALWGKAQGCKIYDLWGVEEGKGFTDFKKRFGPKLVRFVGTYDLVINPPLYWLFRLVEKIRWWILGSLRHMPNILKK